MRTRRQNNQLELALEPAAKGEAWSAGAQGTEARTARAEPERPAAGQQPSMEAVVEPGNLKKALARVRRNKGAPGVDGMTVDELGDHLKAHWPEIRSRLLAGSYTPQPVRRVEIPKASGGVRRLGVPTVLDRFIQQAVMQVLQEEWDPGFSDASYGFRPGRSAHQAVRRAQEHILAGFDFVVDLDLEKFFDRVNHDILMGLVAKRVADKRLLRRLLRLVRGFLTAGVLDGGLVGPTTKGTPQGGPLSPLLSNLMLDVLGPCAERGNLSPRCEGRSPRGRPPRMRRPMRGTGAERPVRAMKSRKLDGAKGSRRPACPDGQPRAREESSSHAKPFRISKWVVWEAYNRVKANHGAAGVDAESVEMFEQDLKNNLYRIWNRMSSGTYFPPPVRSVGIPKKDGSERRLGIPTVADRIAQTVVKIYLEPEVEPQFHPDSYGYRPRKSAIDALTATRQRCWRYDWVTRSWRSAVPPLRPLRRRLQHLRAVPAGEVRASGSWRA